MCSDEETVALMNSPRCSLPDQEPRSSRRRRAVSTWRRRSINWRWDHRSIIIHWTSSLFYSQTHTANIFRLQSYPPSSHLSRETIRALVFYALRVWAEPTPLEFHEVSVLMICARSTLFLGVDHRVTLSAGEQARVS